MHVACVQDVECDEGSVCSVTSETVCELDMCHLEYSGQCTGIPFETARWSYGISVLVTMLNEARRAEDVYQTTYERNDTFLKNAEV